MTYDWVVYLETSAGGWSLETSFPRPNQDMETVAVSTQQRVKLANGDNAFVIPEIRKSKEPFSMFWADTTSAFRAQLTNYIDNGDKIKIITHTVETFIGRIIDMKRVWFTGIAPDAYDIMVTFQETV